MTELSSSADEAIAAVRAFSRFYTRQIGLLDEGLHRTAFSLTEARVLYELAHRDGLTATELGQDLGLDAGYLSRLLKRFAAQGLVMRTPSAEDGRRHVLALTPAGRAAFAPLDEASRREVGAMLGRLADSDRTALVRAMRTVQRLLGEAPASVRLRPFRPGDTGWIIHRQGRLYAEEYGWDDSFEGLVAGILAGFVASHDPARERGWVAERGDEPVGSIFLMRQSETVAKLRLLYVEAAARGTGTGRQLVETCLAFAREAGYRQVTLWTNDVLVPARRLYENAGFRLTERAPHRSFGTDLVGETWTLDLDARPRDLTPPPVPPDCAA
ncbi:bifunctional helix-turn-helix transcriptional regulator/GNAT family N-acetyltransferase [Methylobacterium nodulans]|uniref:Transcriptional regulator, MarR family with acetyltransferase activity n=1 Tax=Methylobacterium nodulans (strain LMG 21967 / CNCM I-2342 / ORS 2060) TaxID=460265 RepID=B8IBW3_METNO|nr:bifunctional helix-turn-helix transcriptional regulator/GNAT family N-acetyltransferase [Methylobacterium nodulans]ACL61145.1 transcriptional regulator, MarR family with acetyltransferase activity [Methylobacterium nodulans ORS 2060]